MVSTEKFQNDEFFTDFLNRIESQSKHVKRVICLVSSLGGRSPDLGKGGQPFG